MAALLPEKIKYIVIHCSATRKNQPTGFAEINAMHKARGWSGFGYHGIIRRDGTIELGRSLQTKGAHVGHAGHNHDSWGWCLEGGLNEQGDIVEDDFEPIQLDTLKLVVKGLLLRAPQAEVVGHRDLSPDLDGDGVVEPHEWVKQCPTMDAGKWWDGVK
jgi:N-acetylmuramoyl-L-alanine amidase